MIDISDLAKVSETPSAALASLGARLRAHERALHSERQALAGFSQHVPLLLAAERTIALASLRAQAPLRFGVTRRLTFISGFVPALLVNRLTDSLAEAGIPYALELSSPTDAPIKLQHSPAATPFEALLRMYTLPKYREIDPTSFMAFTFPLFFGFMLGDIGYGLCLLLLSAIVSRLRPSLASFARIVMLSSLSATLFGILFGEFFGAEHMFGLHLVPLLHRATDVWIMFGIAVAVGAIHVNIGLLFGLVNEARHDGVASALLRKGGWFLLEAGLVLLLVAGGIVPLPYTVPMPAAVIVVLLALAGIAYGEGIRGVLESPMIITHTLSYLRLVAVGLSSVFLALVTNDIGSSLVERGGWAFVAGIAVLLVGHTINLALGLLGPFLHSLRLHYAEFFTKFYEGGGVPYQPFGSVEANT